MIRCDKMTSEEIKLFEDSLEEISQKAKDFGLDFYDMHFEVVPYNIYIWGIWNADPVFTLVFR